MVKYPDLDNEPTIILDVNKLQSGENMRYSEGFEKTKDIAVDFNAAMEFKNDTFYLLR